MQTRANLVDVHKCCKINIQLLFTSKNKFWASRPPIQMDQPEQQWTCFWWSNTQFRKHPSRFIKQLAWSKTTNLLKTGFCFCARLKNDILSELVQCFAGIAYTFQKHSCKWKTIELQDVACPNLEDAKSSAQLAAHLADPIFAPNFAFWAIWANCGFWQRCISLKTTTNGLLLSL